MRFGLITLAAAGVALAQAQQPLPELIVEPAPGGSVLLIRNKAQQPLAAYLIELVDYPGSSFSMTQDELLSGDLIPAGREKRIQVTNMTIGAVPEYVKMMAAIYADGSTAGPPDKIAQMTGRRGAQLEAARELIARLEPAVAKETPKPELMGALTQWIDTLKPPGKPKQDSPAWVNQAAKHSFALHFKTQLDSQTPAEVLAGVRLAEAALASSKPAAGGRQ